MNKTLFKEEQRLNQWWIWLIWLVVIAFAVVPLWYGLYFQITTGNSWGNDRTSNTELAVTASLTTLISVGLILLFTIPRLIVEIGDESICFRYPPLVRKWLVVPKSNIERYTVGKYNPIGEYGGWGVRLKSGKFGRAYSVSGNLGLRIYLKNGEIILLGTRKTKDISNAMEKLMSVGE